jgi:hypothetical protein
LSTTSVRYKLVPYVFLRLPFYAAEVFVIQYCFNLYYQ